MSKKKANENSDLLHQFTEPPQREDGFKPALQRIGVAKCPVCKHESAVYLTKPRRPFINCGFCAARIFYNGAESIRLLKQKMEPIEEE